MAVQYTCNNPLRRNLVLEDGKLWGIDFLEVATPQTTLLVHFLKANPPLTAANISLSGGVRITGITCVSATPAIAVPAFSALPDAARILVVVTSAVGDFSTYTLTVVNSVDDSATPPGFDPRLSSVDFSFRITCPSDFDCPTPAPCPPAQLPAPSIDYLAKDYESFRQVMLDRLAVTMPAWTETNPADLQVALVEVLAYAADRLSYFQDAVATEAYLGTARQRVSVRRHARLLDYQMHDGCNARAWVFIQAAPGVNGQLLPGPTTGTEGGSPGTLLLTRSTVTGPALSSGQIAQAINQGSLAFETMHDVTLRAAHNQMRFYTWSDEQCCLPAGATEATLRNDGLDIQISVGDAIVFEEQISPATGAAADADPTHRCVVRLTSVITGTDPLDGTPVIEIQWASQDAVPFPLCLSTTVTQGGASVPVADVSVARGNLVLADHGQTSPPEALQPAIVPATGLYRPQLQDSGLTFSTPYVDAQARQQPAATVASQDPRAALPAITLTDGVSLWTPQDTLLESGPYTREFVVETANNASATLRFGDGSLGALPVSGLTATYRVGNGGAGNVGAGAIAYVGPLDTGGVLQPATGIVSVRNPLQAQGGIDPETLDEVRFYAPQAFRTQERAVTAADYGTLASAYPGVMKAEASLRWTGSWYTMFITVARTGGLAIDSSFEQGLLTYLNGFRLAGYDLEIESPLFVPLDIAFSVCVQPGYFRSNVEQALNNTFSNRILPNGQTGFFYPGNFTFGQSVYLSRIVAAAMQVPGVQWVDTDDTPPKPNHFQRWGQLPQGETAAGEIDMAPLEIARLDNDPNFAENGRIQFFLDGGL